ncbi:hypothetical protein [Cryobacterium sp. PH31-O1]|uniref:hypothetical protein n=1 Tax=Cryobacterium sp. PH31-O1 TaxID=3046306 RepID=UPI0024BBB8FA|nr:hypothetical protein [Cryobacterium sp. PH31-O1]MDJ0338725.1 hypothetical protein [Cryobacterium sp. PH31-O1]
MVPPIPFDIIDTPAGTAVRTSGGVFLRLTGSPIPLLTLQALAGGHHIALDAAETVSWTRVQAEITDRHEREAAPVWPALKRRILVICTEPALGYLASDLTELGAEVCTVDTTTGHDRVDGDSTRQINQALTAAEPALVLWLAQSLPPWQLWEHLDALAGRGVAWLRMHREGCQLWVDPISLDATDASSAQVLQRRLAASGTAKELASWLRGPTNSPPALSSLASRMVGLRVLDMVQAWAFDAERLRSYRTHAWQFNTRSLQSSEHPVVAYPQPAPIQ